MRILKYFLLLLLLFFLGFTVFVATQKPNYEVVKTKYIAIPKAALFEFVQDYQNWESFNPNVESANQNLEFSKKSEGKNAFIKWDYPDTGSYSTINTNTNDSITFREEIKEQLAIQNWTFKDTIGGTLLQVSSKGVLSFKEKIVSFFKGGPNYVVGNSIEKTLENLKNTILIERNTYALKFTGYVDKPSQFYLKQSVVCRENSVEKNVKIMLNKMVLFFKKNELQSLGKPFILYNKYDKNADIVAFSVCMPIKDSVFISNNSDIQFGKLEAYSAVKAIMTGDHRHHQKAWKATTQFLIKNQYNNAIDAPVIEVLTNYNQTQASERITEIYFPVFPKINLPEIKSTDNGAISDSLQVPVEKALPKPSENLSSPVKVPTNTANTTSKPKTTSKPAGSTAVKKTVKPIATPAKSPPVKQEPIPNSGTEEFDF